MESNIYKILNYGCCKGILSFLDSLSRVALYPNFVASSNGYNIQEVALGRWRLFYYLKDTKNEQD